MSHRAVLLANLGTPDSASVPDVRRYLHEFLGDERVIDRPAQPWRHLLVHWLIVPRRAPRSAQAYARVWTPAGSSLLVISRQVEQKLAAALGPGVPVALAMRYGQPPIGPVLSRFAAAGIDEVLVVAQYPHYAMSSWETVVVKVREEAARIAPRMRLEAVPPFFADDDYIEALYASARPHLEKPHDHLLFSYHGLPARHLRKADSSGAHCLQVPDCCTTASPAHATCYRAQLIRTTQALARRAGLDPERYSISFQSRLVGEPWLEPYTDRELVRLAAAGRKRLLVITPAFVADCLETVEEIRVTGRETFLRAGGESFEHIPCLNDHPAYIEFLAGRVRRWLDRR